MIWSTFIQGLLFLFYLALGFVGNIFVLGRHLYTLVMKPEKRPIDCILIHLAFANTIIICANGSRDVIAHFNLSNILGKASCKFVILGGRMARGLAICTTCLLSVVQAITISPRTTSWRKLKPRSVWQVLSCLLFFWVLSFLISANLLYYVRLAHRTNTSSVRPLVKYCELLPAEPITKWLFLTIMAVRDLIFQGLMGWSSSYMVFRLYQHHKCVLYLQPSRLQGIPSPELRATQSVLMLMICFLFFYWADCIFSFYLGSFVSDNYTVYAIKIFLIYGYASISSFVLISRDVHVAKCW